MTQPPSHITVTLIVAMAENRVIGAAGSLPWRLPADLAHFKRLTLGHPILMGRRTFESIGKPLPERRNIVLTRNAHWTHAGVETVDSFEAALRLIEPPQELFVIGGEQVYRLALPYATRLYVTLVHADVPGDVVFPSFDEAQWVIAEQRHHPADERHAHAMTFQRYERR